MTISVPTEKGKTMDNTREKLIELIQKPIAMMPDRIATPYIRFTLPYAETLADRLVANGVILPPCMVGQEIWVVYSPKHPATPKDKGKWFMLQDGVQRIIYGAKGLSIETWNVGTIPAKEIGKKLFFTKEDAESALKERKIANENL